MELVYILKIVLGLIYPSPTIFSQDPVRFLREDIVMKLNMSFDISKELFIYDYFNPKNMKCQMIGFADACYFPAPHKDCWQTGYIFTIGSTTISWCSQKRNTTFSQSEAPPDLGVLRSVTLMVTSSNHAEIIVLHKESP